MALPPSQAFYIAGRRRLDAWFVRFDPTGTGFVSTNLQDIVGEAAPLASPAFSGTPTAPTAGAGTNTTQLATTAFVTAAVAGAGGGDIIEMQVFS